MFPRRGGGMNHFLLMCFFILSFVHFSHGISGWMEPPIVYAEKGSKVTIICGVDGMDDSIDHSAMLRFENQSTNSEITSGYRTVLNSTAVELTLTKVPEQKTVINCMYGEKGVTTVEVLVGHKPEKINKIECYSDNWVSLNCTFPIPKNYLPVTYDVKYVQGPIRNQKVQNFECLRQPIENNNFQCHVPNSKYRYIAEFFTFNITGVNKLGSSSNMIEFDNYAHIIPNPPTKLKTLSVESDKWLIEWRMPDGKISVISEKLDFQIEVEIIRGCKTNESKEIIDLREFFPGGEGPKNFNHTIELKYSHVWYSAKIRMKLSRAANVEKMWSEFTPVPLQIQSTKRAPDFPPEINVGGFNILPNNDVYFYWRSIHECFQNGNNFTYVVKSQQGSETKQPTELYKDFAIFRQNFPLKSEGGYISINSLNEVGLSTKDSLLRIPSFSERLPPPKNIKKKIKSETKTFVLTWAPPDNPREKITSYTVFWCQAKSEGENKCEPKSFNFRVIDANEEHKFELYSENAENFAISANSKSSTSGMYWATCTTAESKEIGKIRSVWIPRLSSTEIDIEWKLECQDTGIVAGYQIEYCLANATKDSECIGPVEKKNITESLEITKYTLTDLTPYKIYKIFIQLFSSSTMGPRSDALVNTTLQGGEFLNNCFYLCLEM
jgi:Fibronectin type III domain